MPELSVVVPVHNERDNIVPLLDEIAAALRALFPAIKPDVLTGYAERFTRLFSQSIYKWVQAPLGLHVGNLDLDRERALQLPVVESTEWV